MPDDQNVPVGGAGQTHAARVKFASDTVQEKVGDLLAEAGVTLAAVNEDERRHVARRLRKANGAAPLNLLPLLTLLLATCGKAAPDIAGRPDAKDGAEEHRSKEDGERALPPQQEQPALRLVAQQQDGAGARAVGHHRHIADAADLPVEDDPLGLRQSVRAEHH